MKLVDTHIHLTDSRLWSQIESEIQSMQKHEIVHFLNAGFNKKDWLRQLELKKLWPGTCNLAWGLHPYWICENLDNPELLKTEWDFLVQSTDKFDAIGETGFDLREKYSAGKEIQKSFFRKHLELHFTTNKPLILHLVRSQKQSLESLKDYKSKFTGIAHSFSGSLEFATELMKLGFYISFSGSICDPRASKIKKAAKEIPKEFLLLETDSPDQKPKEFDEDLNHSWSLQVIAKHLAVIRNKESWQEIIEISNSNFDRLFKYR